MQRLGILFLGNWTAIFSFAGPKISFPHQWSSHLFQREISLKLFETKMVLLSSSFLCHAQGALCGEKFLRLFERK